MIAMDFEQRDGRARRRQTTRRNIVEAHEQLLRAGNFTPTAAQIAEGAGISIRTLWSTFGDLEGLYQATTEHWFERDDALRTTPDPTAPRADRIEQFTAERLRRFVNITPAARAAALREPFSEALRRSRLKHVARLVEDINAVFAPELTTAPQPDELRLQIVACSSWDAWAFLVKDMALTEESAAQTMARTLHALFADLPE